MTSSTHLELLRHAAEELGRPEATRDTLAPLLRSLVPTIADQATVDVHDGEGVVTSMVAFGDDELERVAAEIARRYPPKPVAHPKEIAMRTGEITFREVTDGFLASIAHGPEHLELLRRFEATESIVVPLRASGRTLGVLSANTTRGRRFTADERIVIELFAGHAASHLDRAFFKRSVLLVEDNPTNRYLLKRVLLHAGFAVREASTGEQALQLARELRPDVAVLDVKLPDMLGFEVCRRLKSDPFTAAMPVIQMSASFVRPEDRRAAREHGADDYLIAPIEPADLVAAVHSLLRVVDAREEGRRTVEREREARRELERANAKLGAVVKSGLLGTFEWDANGVVVDANATLLRLVGRSHAAVMERRLTLDTLLSSPIGRLDEGATAVERELVTVSGARVPALVGATPLDASGASGIAFVLDVTEQRRRAELEALLIGMVSHDLRNPLGIVTMASSVLMRLPLTEQQKVLVGRIQSAGQRSSRLVSDLLDFTLARGAGIELSRTVVDVARVVEQTIADLRAFWPTRAIEHDVVGAASAFLDEGRVAQIAMNLVGNALQHGPPGSPVRVVCEREGAAVVLSVHNGGEPIPPELLPELFAPLRRGAGAGYRHGSIGLGLYIVQHLVHAHGGSIDVVSTREDGTTFSVRFPDVDPLAADPHRDARASNAPVSQRSSHHASRQV